MRVGVWFRLHTSFYPEGFLLLIDFSCLNYHILYKLKTAVLDIDNLNKGTTGDKGNVYHLAIFNLWGLEYSLI